MNIYTKKGDFGYTEDINGQRLSKSHGKLQLQGSIDEVNSGLGHLRALIKDSADNVSGSACQDRNPHESLLQLHQDLKKIQHKLFQIGTDISSDFKENHCLESDIQWLENAIDTTLESTGNLSNFIYLSGSIPATWCHTLRSVTRRAERDFVSHITASQLESIPLDYKYINRLADYFFQTARYLNYLTGYQEEIL